MFSNATSRRSKRQISSPGSKGKGGKGKGKYKGSKGEGKGERSVKIVMGSDLRQERVSERRSVVKQRMLSTVLPKIAELSLEDSDTLFEVLSQGANRSPADVKKYLCKPPADRKKLVLSNYKDRWEKVPAFREIWPADRADLSKALKEWSHQQFVKRSSIPVDSPQEAKRSGGHLSTYSSPAPNDGGGPSDETTN
jgi:hypothetical protein